MNLRNFLWTLIGITLILSGSLSAQDINEKALKSITSSELRDHIYFLASDYLKGRVATTPEYDIATKYVESQFAAAGLEPVIKNEDGSLSYFQGVPFAKTIYSSTGMAFEQIPSQFAKEKYVFKGGEGNGRSSTKNEESRAHYVVTHKKYVSELVSFINEINDGITDFPLIIDNDQDSPGGSDHQSFISEEIPAFFFFSGVHKDLHQPTDDPDKIDYAKAESISRLGYLIANKLTNMDKVPSFLEQ